MGEKATGQAASATSIEQRLRELGLELPPAPSLPPGVRANFAVVRRSGHLLYLSGWGPIRGGEIVYRGKVGREITAEQAADAAKVTGLVMLASLKAELGDLERVARWVKVLGMVNVAPGFTNTPAVINGFSDLIVDLYGPDRGMHARSAVGMAELPFDIPVEIEAIVEAP